MGKGQIFNMSTVSSSKLQREQTETFIKWKNTIVLSIVKLLDTVVFVTLQNTIVSKMTLFLHVDYSVESVDFSHFWCMFKKDVQMFWNNWVKFFSLFKK